MKPLRSAQGAPFRLGALTRKSLADVVRRPARSLLVTLGIVIGVAGLTAINVANDAMHRALEYTSNETQASNITLYARHIDPTLLPALSAVPNVAAVQLSTQYTTRWQIAQAPGHAALSITAYSDLRHIALNPFQLTQGQLPGLGEIVMDTSDGVFQAVAVGDTVTVEAPDGPRDLRVVGLARTLGSFSAGFNGAAQAYMSAAGLGQLADVTGPNALDASVHDITQLDQTTQALSDLLTQRHTVVQGYTTDATPFGTATVDGFFTILRVLSLVALLLTALLIINTVTTLVAEQTAIIGTMKALGGTRATIMRSYLLSVLCYGVVGAALGLALGIAGGYQLTLLLSSSVIVLDLGPFQLAWWVVLVSLFCGLGIPILAALAPVWASTSVTVREAMAAYGISAGHVRVRRGGQAGLARRLTWIPQTTWLGLRNLTRKRGRATLTLLALALSGAAFVAAQTTAYSITRMQAQLDALYSWDIRIALNAPQPIQQARDELMQVPNVTVVEEQSSHRARTPWGALLLQGFSPDTRMYQHQMVAGRWFGAGDDDALVISDLVARKTHLQVGDTMTISLLAGSKDWLIVGVAHDPTAGPNLVGTAFVTTRGLADLTEQPTQETSTFLIQARDRSQPAVIALAVALDRQLSAEGLA
ncbi:MAG TPA: ABC transporter permease, partial [Ktedonobacterales bacterium]